MKTSLGSDLAGVLSESAMREIANWCVTSEDMLKGFANSARSDGDAHNLSADAIAFQRLRQAIDGVTAA